MKTLLLEPDEILSSYDVVSTLYPHVPSLSQWRSWEHAAYRHFALDGHALDLGCGDGRYFRLIWPDARTVVGVELDPEVARLGEASGVYTQVHNAPAHRVPEADGAFDAVFANCSLEHMDHLDAVLAEIHRCLRPGGVLLCSVVTERFVEWSLLPNLMAMTGHAELATRSRDEFIAYHHLANPLTVDAWRQRMEDSGFVVRTHVPILPKISSGVFLLMEGVWHFRRADGGELGEVIHPFLTGQPRFPAGFKQVIAGLLEMEGDRLDCSGAVFEAVKIGGTT